MPATEPQDVHRLFAERFQAGDLEGLVQLYEPTATFVPEPGKPVGGHAAIREAIAGFVALGGTFTMESQFLAQTDEIAQLASVWARSTKNADGLPLELSGIGTEVVRRQADGSWKLAIDNPWGVAGL